MFNVANKTLIAATLCIVALTSCSNKEHDGAAAIYNAAAEQIATKNFSGAMVLLDTLNSRYPAQTQLRKDALRLRAQAMEGIALDSIEAGSQALAQATVNLEAIRPEFRHVESSVGLEGYFLPKNAPEKVMMATGFQARVSDKGFFYIVANVQGKNIGLQSIEFIDGAETISSSAISAARVVKVEGSESCSFNPEDLEGVGAWLESHPSTSKIKFIGTKGSTVAKIDSKQLKQTIECYRFSCALQAQRLASIKREKYERMLATARDQLANLPLPSSDTTK